MFSEKFKVYFRWAIVAACTGHLALLCIPFTAAGGNGVQRAGEYTIAVTFWGSLFLEQIFLRKCNAERKIMGNHARHRRKEEEDVVGIKRHFRTGEAGAAAAVALISAVLTAALAVFRIRESWAVILSVGILFFSLNLYFIFNGKNYRYIKVYKGEE